MKIRQSFVSNSSSMSFVIDKQEFATIKDLAKAMIDFMFEVENDWDYYSEERHKEYLKLLEEAPEVDGIKFPSCNYDTYIYDNGDKYFVDTCNNHECWNFLASKMSYPDFTIKSDFYDIHTKESKVEKIEGYNEWF